MTRFAVIAIALLATSLAGAQTNNNSTDNDNSTPRFRDFDACGVIQEGNGCILFEGGGGTYVIVETGGFDFGDAVRVIGTLDPECISICGDADGCIRGAQFYNPIAYPCGTDVPNFPDDILTNACSSASGALSAALLVGLWFTRRRRS